MSSGQLIFSQLLPVETSKFLLCPDCEINMKAYRCESKLVFKCCACVGVWLSEGGFAVFKQTLDQLDLSKIKKIYKPIKESAYNISTCPVCKLPLYDQAYSYKSDVNLRKCEQCLGFWLQIYDLLSLVQCSGLSQNIKSDANALAKEVSILFNLKSKFNNKLSMLSFYGRNKKWFLGLTPFFLLIFIFTGIYILVTAIFSKVINKESSS